MPGIGVPLLIMGVGMGAAFTPLTTAGIAGVAPADAGAASGLVNVAHQLGGAIGVAVLVTVFEGAGGEGDLAHAVSVALTGSVVSVALALAVVVVVMWQPWVAVFRRPALAVAPLATDAVPAGRHEHVPVPAPSHVTSRRRHAISDAAVMARSVRRPRGAQPGAARSRPGPPSGTERDRSAGRPGARQPGVGSADATCRAQRSGLHRPDAGRRALGLGLDHGGRHPSHIRLGDG